MTNFYEQIYDMHNQESVFGLPEQRLVELIANQQFSQKYACDLGCGDGRQTIYLASNGWDVVAVDNSSQALKKLEVERKRRSLEKNIHLRCENIGFLELEKDAFDLVMCINTIHEIGELATKYLLNKAKESTKEGGVVYLAFFVPYDGTYMKKACYYPFEADIINEFGEWELIAQDRVLFEHEHIILDSKGQTVVHKHMQAHLFFRKQATTINGYFSS